MSILDNILREMGLEVKGSRRKSKSSLLPSPGEIREHVEEIVSGLSELKDVPKAIMDRAVEAESDFRKADRTFRGTRLKRGGK